MVSFQRFCILAVTHTVYIGIAALIIVELVRSARDRHRAGYASPGRCSIPAGMRCPGPGGAAEAETAIRVQLWRSQTRCRRAGGDEATVPDKRTCSTRRSNSCPTCTTIIYCHPTVCTCIIRCCNCRAGIMLMVGPFLIAIQPLAIAALASRSLEGEKCQDFSRQRDCKPHHIWIG
jgi:hypothetical protein